MAAVKRAKRRAVSSDPVADFGTVVRLHRGEVTLEETADPDQPNRTIRRARTVWVPDVLLGNGTIDRTHHLAAIKYHDDYAFGVQGARDRFGIYVDNPASPSGYRDAQLLAVTEYRLATEAVGMVAASALAACVLGNGTMAAWAISKGWPVQRAQGYLLAALDRLVEHYQQRGQL